MIDDSKSPEIFIVAMPRPRWVDGDRVHVVVQIPDDKELGNRLRGRVLKKFDEFRRAENIDLTPIDRESVTKCYDRPGFTVYTFSCKICMPVGMVRPRNPDPPLDIGGIE